MFLDVGALPGGDVLFADELKLEVLGHVGVIVGETRQGIPAARIELEPGPVSSHFEGVAIEVVFVREPPVGVEAGGHVLGPRIIRRRASGDRVAGRCRTRLRGLVEPKRAIQLFVPQNIGHGACDLIGEAGVDDRTRQRAYGNFRRNIRKAERGGGVPRVLDGRIVVDRHAVGQLGLVRQNHGIGKPEVGVVDVEGVGPAIVGYLRKGTEVRRDLAAVQQRHLLRELDAVPEGFGSRNITVRKRLPQLYPPAHDEEREIRNRGQGQYLLALIRRDLQILPVVQLVALQLEHAAEVREFRVIGMAGHAGHAGLPREKRQRLRRMSADDAEQHYRQNGASLKPSVELTPSLELKPVELFHKFRHPLIIYAPPSPQPSARPVARRFQITLSLAFHDVHPCCTLTTHRGPTGEINEACVRPLFLFLRHQDVPRQQHTGKGQG